MAAAPPLHRERISQRCIPNRIFSIIYVSALCPLFYNHFTNLLAGAVVLRLMHLLSDSILAFMWVAGQSFRLRPMRRRVEFIKALTATVDPLKYPSLDIFICTADPYKEPPVSVINTALSLLAYDYPPAKTSVYLSDDAASPLTLFAFFQAALFATHWLPFCSLNGVSLRSPEAFFSSSHHRHCFSDSNHIKIMYEKMKKRIEEVVALGRIPEEYITTNEERRAFNTWTSCDNFGRNNHPAIVKVLLESGRDVDSMGNSMPNLVYISREKKPNTPHNFKAGALNAMLRVSATMTNAPLVLTVDCDMVSNDPQTALRTLCYFLDPKLSPTLSYVQFPQIFNGLNKDDIYAGEYKNLFKINPMGMDGFSGPNYVGTGAFFQRRSLFGTPSSLMIPMIPQLGPHYIPLLPISSPQTIDLAHRAAGCCSEDNDGWGSEMGFRYGSLVEDFYTGYRLHCQGWRSVFCYPERAAFIGEMPTNLIEMINQCKRWAIGLTQILFSKYSTLTFGFTSSMHPVASLSYSYYSCWPLWSIPILFYTTIPQLYLIHHHPLTLPSSSLFPHPSFLLFLFAAAFGQDMAEFLAEGGGFRRWWNEQRMWVFKGVTCFLMGMLEYLLSALGLPANNFNVTSKVTEEKEERWRYDQGLVEFRVASPMFVSLCSVAFLSLVAVVKAVVAAEGCPQISVEIMVAVGVVLICLPVYEAALVRRDKGKIPLRITAVSALIVCCVIFCVGVWF